MVFFLPICFRRSNSRQKKKKISRFSITNYILSSLKRLCFALSTSFYMSEEMHKISGTKYIFQSILMYTKYALKKKNFNLCHLKPKKRKSTGLYTQNLKIQCNWRWSLIAFANTTKKTYKLIKIKSTKEWKNCEKSCTRCLTCVGWQLKPTHAYSYVDAARLIEVDSVTAARGFTSIESYKGNSQQHIHFINHGTSP